MHGWAIDNYRTYTFSCTSRIRQQIADGTFKQKKSVNDEEEDDYDDSDSDDDGIDINVDADEISTAAPGIKVDMIPEEERSTHFLAIRITDAEIADNVNRLQQHIVDQEEVRRYIFPFLNRILHSSGILFAWPQEIHYRTSHWSNTT